MLVNATVDSLSSPQRCPMNQFATVSYKESYESSDDLTYYAERQPSVDTEREENLELIGILLTEEFEDAFAEDAFAVVA